MEGVRVGVQEKTLETSANLVLASLPPSSISFLNNSSPQSTTALLGQESHKNCQIPVTFCVAQPKKRDWVKNYTWQLHYTLGPSLAKQSMFGMFDITNIIRLRRVSDEILQSILCHMDHS